MRRPKHNLLSSAGYEPKRANAADGWWHQLEKFETEDEVRARDLTRLDLASMVATGMFYSDDCTMALAPIPGMTEELVIALIEKLQRTEADPIGGSMASAVCMRVVRKLLIQALLDALADYSNEELAVATVIKRTWAFTPHQLMGQTAAAIKNQFLSDLKRTGVAFLPGPLIAFLHGEYEPTSGLFQLHWHAASLADKAAALHRLKKIKGYSKTPTGAAPIFVPGVNDRIRQISYLLKSFWPQQTVRDGARDRDPQRVDEPYHTLYLTWLDQQRLQDITIMNGVWSRRKGGNEAMKNLYFKVLG